MKRALVIIGIALAYLATLIWLPLSGIQTTVGMVVLIGAGLLAFDPHRPRLAGRFARYAVLIGAATIILTPFFWLLCSAFRDQSIQQEYTFLPPPSMWTAEFLNLTNFRELFRPRSTAGGTLHFWLFVLNSLFLACTITIIHCLGCSLTGYALAKFNFKGRSWIMGFMLATMMVPGMIFLAPMYQIMISIGWVDSYWPFIIPGAIPVFGVFLFRQAMLSVPDEMLEAARVDGAGELRLWWTMALPLTRPMAAAFCLVSFLGCWNNFLGPQIYLHSEELHTLPIVLNQYMGVYSKNTGVFLAGTLLAVIPPAMIFFALQREFVSGLSSGAVKG